MSAGDPSAGGFLQDRYAWQVLGACRGVETSVFFPIADDDSWRAKEVCRRCVVQEPCLLFSLRNRERYGVWGGLSEHERAELFRRGLAQRILSRVDRAAV